LSSNNTPASRVYSAFFYNLIKMFYSLTWRKNISKTLKIKEVPRTAKFKNQVKPLAVKNISLLGN